MKKVFNKINGVFSAAILGLASLIMLFAGTLTYGEHRSYGCHGTGCYGAGNGTGSGYWRMKYTLFSGMGVNGDACALAIIFIVLYILIFLFFLFSVLNNAKKMKFGIKGQIPLLIVINVLLLVFAIYDAVESTYHNAAGGDVIAGFSFLLWFIESAMIPLTFIANKANSSKSEENKLEEVSETKNAE